MNDHVDPLDKITALGKNWKQAYQTMWICMPATADHKSMDIPGAISSASSGWNEDGTSMEGHEFTVCRAGVQSALKWMWSNGNKPHGGWTAWRQIVQTACGGEKENAAPMVQVKKIKVLLNKTK